MISESNYINLLGSIILRADDNSLFEDESYTADHRVNYKISTELFLWVEYFITGIIQLVTVDSCNGIME